MIIPSEARHDHARSHPRELVFIGFESLTKIA